MPFILNSSVEEFPSQCSGSAPRRIRPCGFGAHSAESSTRWSGESCRIRAKFRKGFTLAELVIATLIFGFMAASLTTIFSTAHKHMFQNYRMNTFKSNASVAMKTLTARLQEANRIDLPGPGASGDTLAFVVNVDQLTGCYPVNPSESVTWHYFCRSGVVTAACPSGSCLYYHTGPINGGGAGCPNGPFWAGSYSVSCGNFGGTVTQLASFVNFASPLFSRQGNDLVNINLRVYWDPAAGLHSGNFSTTDKIVDTTLKTTVRVNCADR